MMGHFICLNVSIPKLSPLPHPVWSTKAFSFCSVGSYCIILHVYDVDKVFLGVTFFIFINFF